MMSGDTKSAAIPMMISISIIAISFRRTILRHTRAPLLSWFDARRRLYIPICEALFPQAGRRFLRHQNQ
jgi:hypothetical protein